MVKTGKLLRLSTMALAVAVVSCLAGNANASAAKITWTGADTDNLVWSNAKNWDTGTVPTINDDVVIDQAKTDMDPEIDTDVQVNSIESINGNYYTMQPSADQATAKGKEFTVTIADHATNVKFAGVALYDPDLSATLRVEPQSGKTLALSDVMFEPYVILDLNGATVDLNGFEFGQPYRGDSAKITGDGTLNLNEHPGVGEGQFGLNSINGSSNDYTGTTNINGIQVSVMYINAFGKSDVNIDNGRISWELTGEFAQEGLGSLDGLTIDNKFTINGMLSYSSMRFSGSVDGGDTSNLPTINLPNVALESQTTFQTNEPIINLTGIQANGYCMELRTPDGINESVDKWYVGFPATCNVNANPEGVAGVYPGAPSTGLSFIAKNPAIVAVAGLVAAGLVAVFAKKRSASRR